MEGKGQAVVIGAGPVGLAAGAHLHERDIEATILEMGPSVGHSMQEWGHVRVFTPWKHIGDKAVTSLLEAKGWELPNEELYPTGQEIVDAYLQPAAETTELSNMLEFNAKVTNVTKKDRSKSSSEGRDEAPYVVRYTKDGVEQEIEANYVIDASGTWYSPNPIGTDGLPVMGEKEHSEQIVYGIPDVLGAEKERYTNKTTMIVGGGHSAINAALGLLELKKTHPNTNIVWAMRSDNMERLVGGGENDALQARGQLGAEAQRIMDEGAAEVFAPFSTTSITKADKRMKVRGEYAHETVSFEVDEIIVATGFRPNLDMLREVRLDIDEVVEAPSALAPLIDPNHHSCGTVRPHGVEELSHPDKNLYIVGMKAYGRAPTFLMLTGYEQVRSIAAEIAGDHEAARNVELELPETGVCSTKSTTEIADGSGYEWIMNIPALSDGSESL